MKKVKLVYPINYQILEGSYQKYGQKTFDYSQDNISNKDFDIYLLSGDVELNETPKTFYIKSDFGQVSGDHNVRPKPPTNGLLPADFSKPYRFMYQVDDSIISNYVGQSSYEVKTYLKLDFYIDDILTDPSEQRKHRMFSYRGELFCLLETPYDDKYIVILFRYDLTNQRFNSTFKFDQTPVDNQTSLATSQVASADFVIIDDELYICYRSVDRTAKTNFINIFKCIDNDNYALFSVFNSVEIEPKSDLYIYDDFKFRAEYGGDSFMFVTYGKLSIDRIVNGVTLGTLEFHDMRSYTSFDGGLTFVTYNDTVSNMFINDASSITGKFGGSSLASMFIPEYNLNYTEFDYVDFNINFDLYFDKNMGSFVILKCGDPASEYTKNSFLVGIKTSESNPLVWEPCLKYFIGIDTNNEVDTTDETVNDSFDTVVQIDGKPAAYRIDDVTVVQGETYNWLVLSVFRDMDSDNGSFSQQGIIINQFSFLGNEKKPTGFYDKILAYGSQTHPEYFFVCTVASMDTTGLIHAGSWINPVNNSGSSPVACLWRNQLVVSASQTSLGDGYYFMAVHGPWTNLGEDYGYQSSFTRYFFQQYSYSDWSFVSTGLGSTSYDFTDYKNVFDSNSGKSYLDFGQSSTAPNGSLLDRFSIGNRNYGKCKFQIKFETLTSDWLCFYDFLSYNSERDSGRSIRLFIRADGDIKAENYDGTLIYGIIGNIDVTKYHDFYISVGEYIDRQTGLVIWTREHSGVWNEPFKLWSHFYSASISFQTSMPSSRLQIGVVDFSVSAAYSVSLGDIFVSNYGLGYKPLFKNNSFNGLPSIDPANNFRSLPSGVDDPYNTSYSEVFSNDLTLAFGDKIRLKGGDVENVAGLKYDFIRSKTLSRPESTINNICQGGWNMLPFYGYSFQNTHIYYELPHMERASSVCFMNMRGITKIICRRGLYDLGSESWLTVASEEILLLNNLISVVDTEDRFIEITDNYSKNMLRDKIIASVDSLGDIVSQHIIVENYNNILQLDEPLVFSPDFAYFILPTEYYHEFSTDIFNSEEIHISFEFESTEDAKEFSIGEILIGNYIEIDDITVSEDASSSTFEEVRESEYGYVSSSNPSQRYHHKVLSYSSPYIDPRKSNEKQYKNLFDSLYRKNLPIGIHHLNGDETEDVFFGHLASCDIQVNGYFVDSEFSVNVQLYKGRI